VSTEKAIEIDIARGNPSGTATIMIVIAIVRIYRSFNSDSFENMLSEENIILKVRNVLIVMRTISPAKYPHFPKCPAILSSLTYNGVYTSSSYNNIGSVCEARFF
jgi:hypothetical protein